MDEVESPHGSSDELVYAPAISILAGDLYPRKLEIVREYIQNASDALDSFSAIAEQIEDDCALQVKVSIQGRSLLIWDNGIGMDAEQIMKLKRIAYSEKRIGHEAGHKGIGRLAGIAVADKLVISSTSYGDSNLHRFEFRAKDLTHDVSEKRRLGIIEAATAVINRHTSISRLDVDLKDHYTMVELRDIDERYPELLDPLKLQEFIGDIGPVGFEPSFAFGDRIGRYLREHLPDYSPKTIWMTTSGGERIQIYKPYNNAMDLADPGFIEVPDGFDSGNLLAICWYATKGMEMLGKFRPAGRRLTVDGGSSDERKRFAGLVYKLFGFSVGDRSLPLRTLWSKDYTRALWYTGEIHIIDKNLHPTTDRSDFVENEARRLLYEAARGRIARRLDKNAQDISNTRKAWEVAQKQSLKFKDLRIRLEENRLDRRDLPSAKEQVDEALGTSLRRPRCKDTEVFAFLGRVRKEGQDLRRCLTEARSSKGQAAEFNDLAQEVRMTSQARKVYTIILDTLESFFREDKDLYLRLAHSIRDQIRKRY